MTAKLTDVAKENHIFVAEEKLRELTEQSRVKQRSLIDIEKRHQEEVKLASDALAQIKNQTAAQRSILKSLKADIKENKELLKTQEAQIDEAVKNGNDHIMDLQFEATNIETLKTRAEYELAQLTQKRDLLIEDVRNLERLSNQAEQKYTEENKRYQSLLTVLNERIYQANDELEKIKAQSSEILLSLKAKQDELDKRELALSLD